MRFIAGHQLKDSLNKKMAGDAGFHGLDRIYLESVQKRFWGKVVPWIDGCLEWVGTTRSDGYGVFGLGKRSDGTIRSHRFSYILFNGDISDGLTLDHLCRWTRCVHPDHLDPVTNSTNVRRAGWILKPTCKNGHERSEENTYTDPRGWRECRLCRNQAVRRHRGRDV